MHRLLAGLGAVLILLPLQLSAQPIPAVATRDETIAFLQLFAGDWRGRGEARSAFDDPLETSRCDMTAVFDAATATLTNDGSCATTQGRVSLDGSLSVLADGALTGGFFSRFERAELLSSSGQLTNDQLVLTAVYRAQIRQQEQILTVTLSLSRPINLPQEGNAFGMPIPAGAPAFGMIIEVNDPATQQPVIFSQMVFTADT
jgi:hypothetical protein